MKNIDANEDFSMEDFEAMLNNSLRRIQNGDVLDGKILSVNSTGLLVNVHSYMDAFLPVEELLYEGEKIDQYKVGDSITAMVKHVDTRDGGMITLSRKGASNTVVWNDMEESRAEQKVIDVKVLRAVKGGLVVSYRNNEGFMPASQISTTYVEDTAPYVGKTLRAVITEVDPDRGRIVVSHKVVAAQEEKKTREVQLASLKKGTVLTGKVVRLASYGAFVELAPHMDGLVHISDLSWKRIKSPAEVVKVGETVKVKVLNVDPERGRISLSVKAAEDEAEQQEKEEIMDNYHPDDSNVSTNLGSLLAGFMYKK